MKVDHIETCICADHEPTAMNSLSYGMPQFKIFSNQEWQIFCPKCGRGGCKEYKSQYHALLDWNHMQQRLKAWEAKNIPI